MKHRMLISTLAALAAFTLTGAAHAESASDLSEASGFAVGVSAAAPVLALVGVGSLVVRGVEASADGTAWIIENVADGSRTTIRFAGRAVGASAVAVGTVVTATAIGAGVVLSTAGRVIAFVPNEIGRGLMYSRKVSQ